MRKQIVLGIFVTGITMAWWAMSPGALNIFPLVDAQGTASGWWALRRNALNLTGLLSIGLMSLCMVLSLRQPWMERPLGGLDQVYRLHKWAGIGAGITAIAHWGSKELSGFIKHSWGKAGRPAREAALTWAEPLRSSAKDIGEIAFYILLALLLVTLWQQVLKYRQWRWTHRVMPLIYLALVSHSVLLMPATYWSEPLGMAFAFFFVVGSGAALMSLSGRIGESRTYEASIERVTLLGDPEEQAPLEVICAMPPDWQGHRPGQFVFMAVDQMEGAHPFTIASAPENDAGTAQGRQLLRLVIKPLGDFTRALADTLKPGQAVRIEGPYGRFDAQGGKNREQVWVAAGVGITPFLAFLEARQTASNAGENPQVQMHYCTRNAHEDALLPRIRQLCAEAQPPVQLAVHDEACGELFTTDVLQRHTHKPTDIWFCGPLGLGSALRNACLMMGRGQWRLHRELFAMR